MRCVACGKEYSSKKSRQICRCGEPLEVEHIPGKIASGGTVWKRFRDFFPQEMKETDLRDLHTLSEGETPTIKVDELSEIYDVDLYLKNETVNPTWSFKDRGTVTSLIHASRLGAKTIGTVSTGNMASSVAAYGNRLGSKTVVLVPEDISDRKLEQIAAYDPLILKVAGDYGDLFYESLELSADDPEIYFSNSNSPYRIEGYKTLAFEIIEESSPDFVIIPTSSGGLFRGVMKGLIELKKSGILDKIPTPVSVQAAGCSPIVRAYQGGKKKIERWSEPGTEAGAIANPLPPGGNEVLRKLDEHDGLCTKVSDEEIMDAQNKIASEGIFCQPASAVGVAALKDLRENGSIEKGSEVITIITGSGLKNLRGKFDRQRVKHIDISELKEWYEEES
ncbi:MAG: threonine synthase [Candidatus Thermoplasmatota archaeon]|nr:threonine synthase [Candidatus Thermoplasmatota archaeon]